MKDEAKFQDWWSKVAPQIGRSAALIVGTEGQDIVQDVSVMAVMRFDEFTEFDDFRRWCHKRSNWLALDELARRRRFANDSEAILKQQVSTSELSDFGVLQRLIKRLPRKQRFVTVDRIHGYKTDEIATRHRMTASTVRSTWRHAKQNLVKYFEEENYEYQRDF